MSGRMSLGSLLVFTLLVPGICRAQVGYGNGAHPGVPGAYNPLPPQMAQSYGAPAPYASTGQRTIYEELPDDKGWLFEDAPFFESLRNSFRHSYFRTEFLLWTISNPGRTLLGEYPLSGLDPRDPFPAPDPVTGLVTGIAVAPTLDDVKLDNNNGFRGTMGMPIGPGTFEMSAFVLAESDARNNLDSLITLGDPVGPPLQLPTYIAQPTLVEGLPSDTGLLVYTDSYEARLKTTVWGTEANYILTDNEGRGDPIVFSPLFGLRYLNFNESLDQRGVYQFSDDGGITSRDVERRIYSRTSNNSYGVQFGVRGEFKTKRLTLGAEPKVMFGLNSYKANLITANITSDTDPSQSLKDKETTWGPIADLNVYSRFAMSENLHVVAAYNFMWIGRITRPYDNIVYNTSVTTGQGDFRQSVNMTDAILQGLSCGIEYRY